MNDILRVSDADIGDWTSESPTAQLRFRQQGKSRMIMLEQLWEIRTQNTMRSEWRVVPLVDADAPMGT